MGDNTINNKPTVLIKYGGNAMLDDQLKKEIVKNICAIKKEGLRVVLVHGGGPFIKETLKLAKIESEFIAGHRKTDPRALEYVEMALKGSVNGGLVRLFNQLDEKAVGLSGKDGGMVIAKKRFHREIIDGEIKEYDLGQVGDVEKVNTSIINLLLDNDFIPVITSLASDWKGNDYNINADMFAGHLAGALHVNQYLVLTDVDGLMVDLEDPSSLIKSISVKDIQALSEKAIIKGGMIPKVESCQIALAKGAHYARIINGTKPSQIYSAIHKQEAGTLIKK